jgi:hypothetical protein
MQLVLFEAEAPSMFREQLTAQIESFRFVIGVDGANSCRFAGDDHFPTLSHWLL